MNLNYEEAKTRMPSQREKILNALRDAGTDGVTNTSLLKVCVRWHARMQELYVMGYKIDVESIGQGVCKYILVEEPEVIKSKPEDALSIVLKIIDEDYCGIITSDELKEILDSSGFSMKRKSGYFKNK